MPIPSMVLSCSQVSRCDDSFRLLCVLDEVDNQQTGCDKTTPALIMGAMSVNLPTIVIPGGPMLNGRYRDQQIGSGTHLWEFSEKVRSGDMSLQDFLDAESCMSRSAGHCMVMGTASTMTSMSEALGLTLPGWCISIQLVSYIDITISTIHYITIQLLILLYYTIL